MHRSIATIDSPEFINLQPLDINPMMSKCEIKVLYVGGNRNHSYITKEVATEMAKTLRGAPIVGYYKEDKEDFADHGEQMIWDDEGIHFNCLTKPYGFVSPDAEVWFKKFEEEDSFGNRVEREYLMTTGYLWTGQFEEANIAIDRGTNQSMELDGETLEGRWEVNSADGVEYFIIDDAIFSKLCMLGDDVEPCFEGASVTAPQVSTSFTKSADDDFVRTLFSMMRDLKSALNQEGGQTNMELENTDLENNEVIDNTPAVDEQTPATEPEVETPETEVAPEGTEENAEAAEGESTEPASEDFAKKDDDDEDKKNKCSKDKEEDDDSESDNADSEDEEDDDEDKKSKTKNALIEQELEEIKEKYSKLEADYAKLVEFKNQVDNEKKDELIKSFYMLSDEDKKDVIENKAKYSLEEIEAKLSVICVRKKVNFDLDDNSKNEETVEDNKETNVTTFTLDNQDNGVPAWIKAVVNQRNK